MTTAMLDETIGSFPTQVEANTPHPSGSNITPVSEVPIGASLLWAFLLTTTHNLTLPEPSTLPLQHSVPQTTTLKSHQVDSSRYSTAQPHTRVSLLDGVSYITAVPSLITQHDHVELLETTTSGMPHTKASPPWTAELLENNTTQPDSLNDQPHTTSVEQKSSEGMEGVLVVPERNEAIEWLPKEGGRTAGQNLNSLTARLIAGREGETTLLAGNTMQFAGNGRLLAEPRTTSRVGPETFDGSEGPPGPSGGLSTTHEPLSEVEDSLAAQEPYDGSEGSIEPLTIAPQLSGEVVGSPEPSPEAPTVFLVAPEPPTASLVTSELSSEAESSPEPSPEPITASSVAPEPSGETKGSSEPFTGSSAAPDQTTPTSLIPTKPAAGSAASQQSQDEGCSHGPLFLASEGLDTMPEDISSTFEVMASHEINETVNDTVVAEGLEASRGSGIKWSTFKVVMFVVQLVIMVETVIGNLMVILSVKIEKRLQTPFNYYIVNLAFTDMNVGLSVMSLFMFQNLYDYFPFHAALCHYWVWSDYTMTFESVMTLAAISIDRLWSVTWSLHYRNHNSTRKSLFIILGTWCLVAVIWLPPFLYDRFVNVYPDGDCYWDTVLNRNLVVYVGFLGYYTPLFVMLGAYARILLVVKKRASTIRDAARKPSIQADPSSGGGGGGGEGDQKRLVAAATQAKDDKQEAKLKREMKAVYTLLNIVVIFLLCWVPFYILFVLSAWFPTLFPTWYVTFSYWMAYINSAVNPILYPLSSPEFRQAYKKVILTIIGRS